MTNRGPNYFRPFDAGQRRGEAKITCASVQECPLRRTGKPGTVQAVAIALLVLSAAVVIGGGIAGRWRLYGPGGSVGHGATRSVALGLIGVALAIVWLAVLTTR
jgi:hypothetical protein